MKKITATVYWVLIVLFSFTACENKQESAAEISSLKSSSFFAGDLQPQTDAAALSAAYNNSMFEKAMADSVRKNSTDTAIRALAETMILGHATINTEIKNLADKKRIALPTSLTAEQEVKIASIKNKNVNELAREYAVELVNDHNNAIRTYQQQVTFCDDPEIREWFQNSLRVLNSHLDMANLYKRKLEIKR